MDSEESKKYIKVRVNNIVKTYDSDGVVTRENNYSEITKCSKELFEKTEFMSNFYN